MHTVASSRWLHSKTIKYKAQSLYAQWSVAGESRERAGRTPERDFCIFINTQNSLYYFRIRWGWEVFRNVWKSDFWTIFVIYLLKPRSLPLSLWEWLKVLKLSLLKNSWNCQNPQAPINSWVQYNRVEKFNISAKLLRITQQHETHRKRREIMVFSSNRMFSNCFDCQKKAG